MKTFILALALAVAPMADGHAQQFDGSGCDYAYKKLQQHRQAGACREQTVNRGLDGTTDKGRTARRAEKADRQ